MMKKLIAAMTLLAVAASAVPTNAIAAAALAAEETVSANAEAPSAGRTYSIAELVGLWVWQDGTENKLLTIFFDSTYELDGQTGTVRKEMQKNPDGTEYCAFNLYDADGTFVMGFIEPKTKDGVIEELIAGQDGKIHFVRDMGNAQDILFPNAYGYYQVQKLPDEKLSVKNLEGKWIGGQFEDEFKNCSDLECTFEFHNESGTFTGTVRLEAQLAEDDTPVYFYNLYNDKNEQFMSFIITAPVTDTLTAVTGETYTRPGAEQLEYTDAAQAVPADLTGKWFYQPADGHTAGYVTVDENGDFHYLSDGSGEAGLEAFAGTVTMHYEMTPDGATISYYKFVTEDGQLFEQGILNDEKTVLDLSQDGSSRMVRDEAVRRASATDILGSWILMTHNVSPDGSYVEGYFTQSRFTIAYNEDGGFCTYTCQDPDTNAVTEGTVYATYQLYPEGTTQIWYTFYTENGDVLLSCQETTADDRNTLWIGGFDMAKLEREEAVPNDYGYSDIAQMPVNIADISELQGEWKYEDATLYIASDTTATGWFSLYTEGESNLPTAHGTIKLQYEQTDDGKSGYYYVLYSGNSLYLVFQANKVGSLDTLYTDDTEPAAFVRSAEAYIVDDNLFYDAAKAPDNMGVADLMGKWKQDDVSYETILKFENCDDRNGFFKMETTEEDGSVTVTEGIVKLQYCYDAAGFRQYLYVLYLADKNGDYNQIYMTISAFGETPLNTLYLSNVDYSFSRVTQKYSYEKLAEMAKKDYEQKTGILPADTKIIENAGGTVTIVLLDENGNDLDAYTVDPDTGIGERFSDESEVNLPQTGMSGIHKALTGLAALMGITGMALIKKSRKENEE